MKSRYHTMFRKGKFKHIPKKDRQPVGGFRKQKAIPLEKRRPGMRFEP